MYETITQVYGANGVLIPAGKLIELSPEEAQTLMRLGAVKPAVYAVAITAPDAVTAKRVQAETEALVKAEVEKRLQQEAINRAADEAAEQAKLEAEKAEAYLAATKTRRQRSNKGAVVVDITASNTGSETTESDTESSVA